MTSPLSATPESSRWSALTSHTAPRSGHRPIHDSPLLQGCNAGSSPFKHHSTPQKLGLPAPVDVGSKLTPVRYYESKLLSTIRSPCQKSYTPLSATPCGTSPAFKTPIRISSTHSPHPTRTPVGTKLPKSASKFITPQSQIINPFEDRLLSTYHGSVLSPGGFALTDTPGSEEKGSFRWTIDQLAILHPADIDEMSCEDSLRTRFDKEVEETAQRAISDFFAKNSIVPSPWQGSDGKPVYVAMPKSPNGECDKTCDNGTTKPKQSQDAACQTTLTLPMDFDLQKILGEFMTYQGSEEDGNPQEALSTSSLRRKLFFHGESSPASSPIGKVEGVAVQCDRSPRAVPLKPLPLSHTAHSGSPQFSSSPITMSKGGPFSRVSEEMDVIISPELSPINLQQSPVRRPSDHDGNLCGSFMSSPLPPPSFMRSAFRSQHNAMASPELSPIGPRPKSRSRLSLDVSPICSPVAHVNDMHSPRTALTTQENTPSATSHPVSVSVALSTPSTVGTSKVSDNSVLVGGTTLVTTPQFCVPLETSESCANPFSTETDEPPHVGEAFQHPRLVMSDISMDVTGMETDYVAHSTGNPLIANLPDTDDKSLCYPMSRECSMVFEETTQQGSVGNVPTSQHSQDTGYQTCSLQLTGQDTGLHTNLTQQFGSLPFRSFSEADCMDEGIEQGKPLPKPVIFKEKLDTINTSMVSRQLSYPPSCKTAFTQEKVDCLQTKHYMKTELEGCALIQEGLTEDQVIAKARYLLGQTGSVTSALSTKPSGELLGVSSQPDTTVPHLTWQPSCSSTPQKTNSYSSIAPSQPPSEVAMAILRRAEKDLVKYGSLATSTESA
ncbi:protein aurora borealis-like [Liolophura sinensis]|uniref:protein aurora borealis-like n=1 Tax=Liolophura sinensis TaxID=3198878 RepID=UPI00315824BC